LPPGCLERRIYEESNSPTNLLLIEQWSETGALKVQLLSDQFRALIGAVKVLGKTDRYRHLRSGVDSRSRRSFEGGRILNELRLRLVSRI
jgi:hypothetical protein